MTARQRADRLLVERGLFESRAKAQAAIAAGLVWADGALVTKPSDEIAVGAELRAEPAYPWVSRAGVKLAAALEHFGFDPKDCICLDVGASTGGFTQVLAERGAARVYAVDVGTDQLHSTLRNRGNIVSLERTDIRILTADRLGTAVDLVTIDVSFISLALVLPAALALARCPARLVALIKPQYETGRAHLKKGVVRDARVQDEICRKIETLVRALGWTVIGTMASPLPSGEGNREFLLGAEKRKTGD